MRFDITEHERLGDLDKSITGYRSQTQALFYLLTVQQVRRAQLVALKVCCGQFLLLLLLGVRNTFVEFRFDLPPNATMFFFFIKRVAGTPR